MKRLALIAGFCAFAVIYHPMPTTAQSVAPTTDPAQSFRGADRANDLARQSTGIGFSLLDPTRLQIHHSYSMSYFSGGGQSGSIGLYMSTLEYQLSRPLTVRVGLGYLHQPLGFLNDNMVGPEGGRFLPNVQLDFSPSDKMHLRFDYRTVPTSSYDYGYGGMGWYSPWSRSALDGWGW